MPRIVSPDRAGANPVAHPKLPGPDAETDEARDCKPRLSRCESCPGLHFCDGGVQQAACRSSKPKVPVQLRVVAPFSVSCLPVRNRQRFTVLVRPGAGCKSPDRIHFEKGGWGHGTWGKGKSWHTQGRVQFEGQPLPCATSPWLQSQVSRGRPSGRVGFIRRLVGRNTLACEIFTSR